MDPRPPHPSPAVRHQESAGAQWLKQQGSRNYEPFLSARWREQDRLFHAIRTGRVRGPRVAEG